MFARPTRDLLAASRTVLPVRRDRIEQHLGRPAEPGFIAGEADPLLELEQHIEPAALFRRRDIVREVGRGSAGSDGVGGREDLVVADSLEQVQRRLELGLGLAAEPDDDVGRDGDAGDGRPDGAESLEVVLDRVLAAHPAEHGVVARLDRQMKVLADRWTRRHGLDEPVRQVPRVRRYEAQARDRRGAVGRPDGVDRPDEFSQVRSGVQVESATGAPFRGDVRETRFGRQVVAIRVDVLAEQGHLAVAGRGQGARLVHDRVEWTAAFRAAAEWDDAVRARLVAAVDDRQPGADRRAAGDLVLTDGPVTGFCKPIRGPNQGPADQRRRAGREERWGADPVDCPDRARRVGPPDGCLRGRQAESIDELGLLVRTQKHVDRRIAPSQPSPVRFAHGTAGEHHPHARIGGLEPGQLAHPADHLLLGAFADGAGVDDHQVGRVEGGRLGAPGRQESTGHFFRVAVVHLATQRPDVEAGQGARLWTVFPEALVGGRLRRARIVRAQFNHRRRGEVEHRQRAGHVVLNWLGSVFAWRAHRSCSPTSGGTHSPACSSA